ncbi:hypothetical protein ACFCZ1_28180 [Streptomyces sp. NPDC056224]|uniref:hypothetical protein n=1 Tax=Streptomyces sp. NPDC056224 TaxID=3345750 RepID=UPI0035D6738E
MGMMVVGFRLGSDVKGRQATLVLSEAGVLHQSTGLLGVSARPAKPHAPIAPDPHSWPQLLETDRARVHDPDSVGVVISGPAEAVVGCAIPQWLADVDFVADLDDAGCLPASGITSPSDFGARMDQWVTRVFGSLGSIG